MIDLENITKTYGKGINKFQALKGINIHITKGEFVAIVGHSGSGKSTLMNILGALDRQTTGEYKLNGRNLNEFSNKELADFRNQEVGFIFQRFNLLDRTSVYDNVALPGLYGNIQDLEKTVTALLKEVGLLDKKKNLPSELSGGETQRVAIARALLMNPAIIMADEPTGNLDSKTAVEIMGLIKKVHTEGNTIILITHEDNIAAYANRKITLKDGEIIKDEQQK